jgi:hypothetical protein
MRHLFDSHFHGYHVAIATPRSLPRADQLSGRVVMLDLAFAYNKPSGPYPSVTHKLIAQLGDRLALFLDHHDSDFHKDFDGNSRFVLATKAEHGACPEMINPEIVAHVGEVNTILCHGDFDGLVSAAKWILGGQEPYSGSDQDAWCIDTRMGEPSAEAQCLDRALRADPKNPRVRELVLRLLIDGFDQTQLWREINHIGKEIKCREEAAEKLAEEYQLLSERVAYLDVRTTHLEYDRTHLLLLGQKRAQIAVIRTYHNVGFAAPFNSGVNFLNLFSLSGGMPTVVTLPDRRLRGALIQLGVSHNLAHSTTAAQ